MTEMPKPLTATLMPQGHAEFEAVHWLERNGGEHAWHLARAAERAERCTWLKGAEAGRREVEEEREPAPR